MNQDQVSEYPGCDEKGWILCRSWYCRSISGFPFMLTVHNLDITYDVVHVKIITVSKQSIVHTM